MLNVLFVRLRFSARSRAARYGFERSLMSHRKANLVPEARDRVFPLIAATFFVDMKKYSEGILE
jgi:hypothetical protein